MARRILRHHRPAPSAIRKHSQLPVIITSKSAPFVANKIANLYGFSFFRYRKLCDLVKAGKINRKMNLFFVGLYCKDANYFSQYHMLTQYFNKTIIAFAGTDILQLMDIKQTRDIFHALFNKVNNIFTAVGANKMFLEEDVTKLSPEELKIRITDLGDALKMIEKNILIINDGLRKVYDDIKKEKGVSA